eukprot:1036619-Rhodomonas_salina.1
MRAFRSRPTISSLTCICTRNVVSGVRFRGAGLTWYRFCACGRLAERCEHEEVHTALRLAPIHAAEFSGE